MRHIKSFFTKGIPVLKTLLAAVLLSLAAPTAMAAPLIIGHRGANTTTIPENTLKAMQYATPHAQALEADIQWTKDSDDADSVGTIIIFHDSTLNRVTNCSGNVSDRLWGYIRDNCRTDIAGQTVAKLTDLLRYANNENIPIHFDLKTSMTTAQARQFWKHAKTAPAGSMLIGTKSRVDGIQKVKRLDAADTAHKLRYGYVTTGEPSVAYVKTVGPYLIIEDDISKAKVAHYKAYGLKVYLWVGKTEADYASMVGKNPNGVSVDDAKRYQDWLVAR